MRISVADTGCGIQPEHLTQIFQPFFSTKPHTGTGLGRWVSREIVEKRGGSIRARSKPGHGTIISMFLPD